MSVDSLFDGSSAHLLPQQHGENEMKYAVTLKQLRKAKACACGYNKVVCMLKKVPYVVRETYIRFAHDDPIPLVNILEATEPADVIWCLRITNDERDNRLFAVWCARQVQHLMTDNRSISALDVAEKYANGQATTEELAAAWSAAWSAAMDAAWSAAMDAAWSAAAAAAAAARTDAGDAASDAASDAAGAVWSTAWAARSAQKEMLIKMCNGTAPWQIAGENEMNVEQAINAADESEAEGLRGLYPTAAQVLAAEVRDLRESGRELYESAKNLITVKGRHHSEMAMVRLAMSVAKYESQTKGETQ